MRESRSGLLYCSISDTVIIFYHTQDTDVDCMWNDGILSFVNFSDSPCSDVKLNLNVINNFFAGVFVDVMVCMMWLLYCRYCVVMAQLSCSRPAILPASWRVFNCCSARHQRVWTVSSIAVCMFLTSIVHPFDQETCQLPFSFTPALIVIIALTLQESLTVSFCCAVWSHCIEMVHCCKFLCNHFHVGYIVNRCDVRKWDLCWGLKSVMQLHSAHCAVCSCFVTDITISSAFYSITVCPKCHAIEHCWWQYETLPLTLKQTFWQS